jgi:hypothetical protein
VAGLAPRYRSGRAASVSRGARPAPASPGESNRVAIRGTSYRKSSLAVAWSRDRMHSIGGAKRALRSPLEASRNECLTGPGRDRYALGRSRDLSRFRSVVASIALLLRLSRTMQG